MALIKHELKQIKIRQLYESIFSSFNKKTRNIQANRTTDALLITYVLSCETSLYWEYKCNIGHKWTKELLLTMTEIFTVMVEPQWIYSVLERPHTLVQNHYTATQWQALILDFLSFFPSPVYFNRCIYQDLSGSFYLGEGRKVIMMWCLKKLKSILNQAGLLIRI